MILPFLRKLEFSRVLHAWTGCPSMVGGRNIGEVVRVKSPRKQGRMVMVVEGIFPFE